MIEAATKQMDKYQWKQTVSSQGTTEGTGKRQT